MSFLSPWFLAGLLGVGIPLAIHLIRKQKAEKVVFSTLRFLKKTPKKMILFQQIQQWLLLLARAAIVALLAVAFARPFFTQSIALPTGVTPRSVVVLLDASMSMQYGDYFERAKRAAFEVLRSLHAGDEAALVTFAEGTGKIRELTTDIAGLEASLQAIGPPGFQATASLAALRLADQMLRSARYPDKTVVMISDYQRRAFENIDAGWRLGAGVVFKSIKIGDPETTNLAVTEVKSPAAVFRDQEEHVIVARVRNLGTRPLSKTRVSLAIDDLTVDTRNVELTGQSETIVKLRTKFRKRGVYRGAVTVADDRFAPDNTFYFTVNVLTPLRVLAVIEDPADDGRAGATQWFEWAMGRRDRTRFQIDVLRPRQVTLEAVNTHDVMVLFDVRGLQPVQVRTIETFVREGGSLLIAPAGRVTAQTFNSLLDGLTPARLERQQTEPVGKFRVIAELNLRHPIIRTLQIGRNNDLGRARFRRYWFTKPVEGSEIIMGFDNGQAALLEGRFGRGRVLLFTSSLDTTWNNLPLQGLYLPLMQETLRYLAPADEKKQSYVVGEPVRMKMPPGNALRVTDPDDAETVLTSATGSDVVYRNTLEPGFYDVRGGEQPDFLAVNVSSLESDLAASATEEIEKLLSNPDRAAQSPGQARASAMDAKAERSQRWWWWILLAAGLLALGETLLSNRTYR